MHLDIRLPIGLLFALLGGLLVLYGLLTQFSDPEMYEHSLGININLWWGVVMALFGALMIRLGRKGASERPSPTP
ncbi:MAG: hypothetical protein U0790_11780 [Isosphaeraceae bacterium]